MFSLISRFLDNEDAAVTVDWVVLTAGLVTVGLAVVSVVKTSLEASGTSISSGIVSAVSAVLS